MKKDGFYVQLHMHTSDSSGCGRASAEEMTYAAKTAGYDLIVITDHFMNANIGCPSYLPWPDKVEYLFRGYRSALKTGKRLGVRVLAGWETCNAGPEYLTYGLDEDFLVSNPDIADVDGRTYLARIREAGGFVIHAHPFRKASYIPDFTPDPRSVEAFEVFNAGHRDPSFDARARAMARKFDLIMTAGSDAHTVDSVHRGAMRFAYEITSSAELIAALRKRDGEIVETLRI